MKIVISPTKKMNKDTEHFPSHTIPCLIDHTKILLNELQGYSFDELKKIYRANDQIVEENQKRIAHMNLENDLSMAIMSYQGLVFQHIGASGMDQQQLDYLQEHLRILSGFYGVLKPFDGITPYRLEMQSKLPITKNLYEFWGDMLYQQCQDDWIINLASLEYSKCIEPYLDDHHHMLTIQFLQEHKGKLVSKATNDKMARGDMVWYMAYHQITQIEQLKQFDLGYRYVDELSDAKTYTFVLEK